jgi:hypothetical protein
VSERRFPEAIAHLDQVEGIAHRGGGSLPQECLRWANASRHPSRSPRGFGAKSCASTPNAAASRTAGSAHRCWIRRGTAMSLVGNAHEADDEGAGSFDDGVAGAPERVVGHLQRTATK